MVELCALFILYNCNNDDASAAIIFAKPITEIDRVIREKR
jgi:hypothetical protein